MKKGCLIAVFIFVFSAMLVAIFDKSVPNGYYNYHGTQYYRQGTEWYYYDANADDWFHSSDLDGIDEDNYKDYRIDNHRGKDFEQSTWYDAGNTSDDYDWDDDDDWDYDDSSWDSGSTDWDSDW